MRRFVAAVLAVLILGVSGVIAVAGNGGGEILRDLDRQGQGHGGGELL